MVTNIHDFEIKGLSFDRNSKILRLDLTNESGDLNCWMYFYEVEEFWAEGFNKQNVVLDLISLESDSTSDYFRYCLNKLNLNQDNLPRGKKIVYIEPSIGLEIVCCCKDFSIEPAV